MSEEQKLIEQIDLEDGCSAHIYELPKGEKFQYGVIIWGPHTNEHDLIQLPVLRILKCDGLLESVRRCLPDWAEDAFHSWRTERKGTAVK